MNVPSFWKGRVDTRLSVGAVLGGIAVLIGAAIREMLTGGGRLFASILLACAIFGLLLLYGYMRLWNARSSCGLAR